MSINFTVPKLGYQPALDGIRSIAVMLVVLSHANFQLAKNGSIGVSLFFTLSGFLITTLLLEEYQTNNRISLKAFYIRRTMRLFPALYFLLFVVGIFTYFFKEGAVQKSYYDDILYSFLYIYNIASVEGWVTSMNLLYHMWSLGIEEQYYIMWPAIIILFLFYKKTRHLSLILLILIITIWFLKQFSILPSLPAAIINESILIGCFGALLRWYNAIFINKIPLWLALSFLLSLVIFGAGPFKHVDAYHMVSNTCSFFIIVVILYVVANKDSLVSKYLSIPPMVFIGKISYSLYLWHLPVFRVFAEYSTLPSYLSFILKFVVAFALSYFSWIFIEKATTALGRKWSSNILAKSK